MTLLIHNAKLVTWGRPNEILDDWGIYLSDGHIADLGSSSELHDRYPEADKLDASG